MPDQSEHSIATVAYSMVRRYHIDKDEWCHQCKLKKQVAFIVTCHNGRCSKRFCGYCLWNRYCLRQVDIEKMKNWKVRALVSYIVCVVYIIASHTPPLVSRVQWHVQLCAMHAQQIRGLEQLAAQI
jgi:hypothetical protein